MHLPVNDPFMVSLLAIIIVMVVIVMHIVHVVHEQGKLWTFGNIPASEQDTMGTLLHPPVEWTVINNVSECLQCAVETKHTYIPIVSASFLSYPSWWPWSYYTYFTIAREYVAILVIFEPLLLFLLSWTNRTCLFIYFMSLYSIRFSSRIRFCIFILSFTLRHFWEKKFHIFMFLDMPCKYWHKMSRVSEFFQFESYKSEARSLEKWEK